MIWTVKQPTDWALRSDHPFFADDPVTMRAGTWELVTTRTHIHVRAIEGIYQATPARICAQTYDEALLQTGRLNSADPYVVKSNTLVVHADAVIQQLSDTAWYIGTNRVLHSWLGGWYTSAALDKPCRYLISEPHTPLFSQGSGRCLGVGLWELSPDAVFSIETACFAFLGFTNIVQDRVRSGTGAERHALADVQFAARMQGGTCWNGKRVGWFGIRTSQFSDAGTNVLIAYGVRHEEPLLDGTCAHILSDGWNTHEAVAVSLDPLTIYPERSGIQDQGIWFYVLSAGDRIVSASQVLEI